MPTLNSMFFLFSSIFPPMRLNFKILIFSLALNFKKNLQISDWKCAQLLKRVEPLVNCPSFDKISQNTSSPYFSMFCRYFSYTVCHLSYDLTELDDLEAHHQKFCAQDIININTSSSMANFVRQNMQNYYDRNCFNHTTYAFGLFAMNRYELSLL